MESGRYTLMVRHLYVQDDLMRWLSLLALLLLLSATSSCSGVEDRAIAEREVAAFHQAYNEQEFASSYDTATPGFRQQRSRDEFVRLLGAVHRRLGPVQSSYLRDWTSRSPNWRVGMFTTVTVETRFASGTATETFVFLTARRGPRLVSYDINSVSPAVLQ